MRDIKILLADDHSIVMDGLQAVLSADEEMNVVGMVGNGQEVIRFVRQNDVDVVVLDINMPVMDGISCARTLKSEFPQVKIIILTMYAQRSFVNEIIKLDIDGCLLKNNTGKELIDAILRIMSGSKYYDRIRQFKSEEDTINQYKLSERELEIIRLMAEGLTTHDIAGKLFLSEHTVRTHRKNILKKLDLKNSSHVVQFAVNNQLI